MKESLKLAGKSKNREPAGQGKEPAGQGKELAGQGKEPAGQGKGQAGQGKGQAGQGKGPVGQDKEQAGWDKGQAGQGKEPAGLDQWGKVRIVQDIQVEVQWVSFQLAVQGRGEVVPGPLQHRQQVEQGRHRAGVEVERGSWMGRRVGKGMLLW